jgi:hypothetical protein
MDGTIFCSECGASLFSGPQHETTTVLGPGSQNGAPAQATPSGSKAPAAAGTSLLGLVVLRTGRRVALDVTDDLLVGRRDEKRGIIPDIDLGEDGGYDAGVSRRHAILSFRNGHYLVEDLDSANGTFVNDQPVNAQSAAQLRHGDVLRFGTLTIRVEIQ